MAGSLWDPAIAMSKRLTRVGIPDRGPGTADGSGAQVAGSGGRLRWSDDPLPPHSDAHLTRPTTPA